MLTTVLDELRTSLRFAPHVTAWHRLLAESAHHADWPAGLNGRVVSVARRLGILCPWTHQAQAIRPPRRPSHRRCHPDGFEQNLVL